MLYFSSSALWGCSHTVGWAPVDCPSQKISMSLSNEVHKIGYIPWDLALHILIISSGWPGPFYPWWSCFPLDLSHWRSTWHVQTTPSDIVGPKQRGQTWHVVRPCRVINWLDATDLMDHCNIVGGERSYNHFQHWACHRGTRNDQQRPIHCSPLAPSSQKTTINRKQTRVRPASCALVSWIFSWYFKTWAFLVDSILTYTEQKYKGNTFIFVIFHKMMLRFSSKYTELWPPAILIFLCTFLLPTANCCRFQTY